MPEIMPWHKTQIIDPDYNRVDLVKEGANSQAHIKLFKNRGGENMGLEAVIATLKPEHQAAIRHEVAKSVKDAEEAKDKIIADLQKAKDAAEAEAKQAKDEKDAQEVAGKSEEEIVKSIKDPAIRALMETQIAKTKAAEAEVKKSRDAALEGEAIAKSAELTGLGAEDKQLVDLYKKMTEADPELRDEVFGILKAAKAQVAEGNVTQEIGKSAAQAGVGAKSEEDAWNKIEAKADEISKARGISKQAAISKAIEENSALYAEYLKAQQGY